MTLAEKMYNEYAPHGSKMVEENRKDVLESIACWMGKGEVECDFDIEPLKPSGYPEDTEVSDFLIYTETIDYLKDNGFEVTEKRFELDGHLMAVVSWKHLKEKYNEELS